MKIAVAGATGRVGKNVVEILEADGHEVVAMSRSTGVDVITGDGLAEALTGVEVIIDAASTPSPDQETATEFFTTAANNLQRAGAEAGVKRLVVVSIIGIDHFSAGYNAAKRAHEEAVKQGPLPVQILRAAQFHEFVELMMAWGTQGDTVYIPTMRTQLIAARAVAQELVTLALTPPADSQTREVAGPREENLTDIAKLILATRGENKQVVGVNAPEDPDGLYEKGVLLPGPTAILAGPTFEDWFLNR